MLHFVYICYLLQGLHLAKLHLENEKRRDEAEARIRELEEELQALIAERDRRQQQSSSIVLPETIDKKSRWWFTGY